MASIRKLSIVPKFPSAVAARAVTGAGGRMLGQKMAIQEGERWNRQSRQLGQQASIAGARLNQQADIANARLSLQKQKADQAMSKLTIEGAKFYRGLYNKYTSEKAKENAALIKKYRDPAPIKSWAQWMNDEQGIDVSNLGVKDFQMAPTQPKQNAGYMEGMYQDRGGDAGAASMLKSAIIDKLRSLPNTSNLGPAIKGFAEGGIVDTPQMAMVGEQGREFIVPENKVSPQMAQQLQQTVGGQQGQQVPTREGLAQLMSQIPQPKKIVSDRLPKLEQLMAELDRYDSAEDALNDLIELDTKLMEVGLDLADVEGIQQFVAAYAKKFGDIAAQTLMQEAVSRRGQ